MSREKYSHVDHPSWVIGAGIVPHHIPVPASYTLSCFAAILISMGTYELIVLHLN